MTIVAMVVILVLVLALVAYGAFMLALVKSLCESSSSMTDCVSSVAQNQSDICSQMAFQICTPKDQQVDLVEAMMDQQERPLQPAPNPMIAPDMSDDY